jgi:hypothetical protein
MTAGLWLIGIGAFTLARTTGTVGTDPVDLALQSWPWAAIALGAWLLIGSAIVREGAVSGGVGSLRVL